VAAIEPEWPLETAEAAADARAGQWRPAGIKETEKMAQCDLLRDLVGDPFRAVGLDPCWLNGTVVNIARAIYDEGRFRDLPILGDALVDAGCDLVEVVAHCRSQALHVGGCWLVDAILGKK
jgi:hypothetical protein